MDAMRLGADAISELVEKRERAMLLINGRFHMHIQDVRMTLELVTEEVIVRCEETPALQQEKQEKPELQFFLVYRRDSTTSTPRNGARYKERQKVSKLERILCGLWWQQAATGREATDDYPADVSPVPTKACSCLL